MFYQQSKKAAGLMQSEIRNMSAECDRVGGINLSQGICDLKLEDVLATAVQKAVRDGENHYTSFNGVQELREQIAHKATRFNNIKTTADCVTVSCGSTGALYSACYALFEPGDEVILFEPYYGYHEYTLTALDLVPRYVTLTPPCWDFDLEELQAAVGPRTKAIMLCTPSNPCGKVFTEEELTLLGAFCEKNNLIALTDEIYEYITYDGRKHISPASLPAFDGRTVTISGYSKTFSITGWRIGYCITQPEIAPWVGNASDLVYVCAPAPLQYGVAAGIRALPPTYYTDLQKAFQEKRDLLCSTLSEIGFTPYIPQGAYYVLADISALPGDTAKDKVMHLLNKTGVATVPGDAFYKSGKGARLARFCFAKDMEVITQACERLKML